MRVVIDPNVFVSAAVAKGVSRRVLDLWLTERPFELVVCPTLLEELRDVLSRDRFRRWLPIEDAEMLVERLRTEATAADDPASIERVTPDPDDDYLVALARQEGADVIVSGDPDLTGIEGLVPPVLAPAAFLALFRTLP